MDGVERIVDIPHPRGTATQEAIVGTTAAAEAAAAEIEGEGEANPLE